MTLEEKIILANRMIEVDPDTTIKRYSEKVRNIEKLEDWQNRLNTLK